MVGVLVTGANGYIGGAVAQALRRAGHVVYALIRDEKQKDKLLQNEIIPVVGDGSSLDKWSSILDKVSVVVDNIAIFDEEKLGTTNKNIQSALAKSVKNAQKKRFVYTSGILVYNYPGEIVDESYPPNGIQWRGKLEEELIKSHNNSIDTVVIRPGWVYGGSGGFLADLWFNQVDKKEIEFYGNTEKSWGWVHVQDLADAYVHVVEASSSIVDGEIFDVTDSTRVTCLQARIAFAKAASLLGQIALKPVGNGAFDKAMEFTAVPRSDKIRRQLRWEPKLAPLTDHLDLYYFSWKANQDKNSQLKQNENKTESKKETKKETKTEQKNESPKSKDTQKKKSGKPKKEK